MAESKDFSSLDSARFALTRPLFKSGKALMRFFGVGDSVNCLDSITRSYRIWVAL